jgi:hypothetical protein
MTVALCTEDHCQMPYVVYVLNFSWRVMYQDLKFLRHVNIVLKLDFVVCFVDGVAAQNGKCLPTSYRITVSCSDSSVYARYSKIYVTDV